MQTGPLQFLAAVLCRIPLEEPAPLSVVCPAAPPSLCQLVERMLRKEPAARPPDASAIAAELSLIHPAADHGIALAVTILPPPHPAAPVLASEQILLSIVLARPRTPTADRFAATLAVHGDAGIAAIEGLLSQVGARAHLLVEGTLVVTLPSRGSARDQVTLAARTALLLRDRLPDTSMVLVTGRPTREGPQVCSFLRVRAYPGRRISYPENPTANLSASCPQPIHILASPTSQSSKDFLRLQVISE